MKKKDISLYITCFVFLFFFIFDLTQVELKNMGQQYV